MRKLVSLFLVLSQILIMTIVHAEAPAGEPAAFTVEELFEAGTAAKEAGEFEKALEYFELAADRGDVRAINELGIAYELGYGVEQSWEKAAEYYRISADQGYANAQVNLGICYLQGAGVEQSFEKAIEYFRRGADQGYSYGQFMLGWMHYEGWAVEQSYEKAAEYYQLAADQGNDVAMISLGGLYESGLGVEQSYEKAMALYQQAAALENNSALISIGLLYENGYGVEQSFEKAEEYFLEAKEKGEEDAEDYLIGLAGKKIRGERRDGDRLSALKTIVDQDHLRDYDFTDKALEYLALIGERFPDRTVPDENTDSQHDACADWLIAELEACGFDRSQIEEQRFSGINLIGEAKEGRNIIVTIPGRTEEQIIVGAHYDGDGFGDNASGTALLLANAAGLADSRPQYTLRFAFFDAEEENLLGSRHYALQMSEEEIKATLFMINLDTLLFGDFCNLYGGVFGNRYFDTNIASIVGENQPEPEQTEAYEFAADTAEKLGFRVYRPADLDGYFEQNGRGMQPEDNAFFTNPWTNEHPAPLNMIAVSPAVYGASDHAWFAVRGIPYICFDAENWWSEGSDPAYSYIGIVDTYDKSIGDGGRFMETEFDTPENLERFYPDRAEQHFRQFSPLLSALLLVYTEESPV